MVGEGVSAFESSIACEVFGVDRTEDGVPAFDVAVCSADPGPVRSRQGFSLIADHRLDRLATADLVLVTPSKVDLGPGGDELDAQLWAAVERGARVASLCSAAFTLARAGLLDGRRATTHHMFTARLAAEFPQVTVVPDVLYVEVRPVPTSAGTAAGVDLCLHLPRPPHDGRCRRRWPGRGSAWTRRSTWPGWSRQAVMSPRSFARRFRAETGVTPYQWLLEQRVALARVLLEEGDDLIDQVARRCGFGSGAAFRQHFSRLVGTTPTAYRRAFRGARPGRRTDDSRPSCARGRKTA